MAGVVCNNIAYFPNESDWGKSDKNWTSYVWRPILLNISWPSKIFVEGFKFAAESRLRIEPKMFYRIIRQNPRIS